MSVIKSCKPRSEVLQGDLTDAIFAADFCDLIDGKAPEVYAKPAVFFRNTHPAAALKNIVGTVFETLSHANGGGATIRLSTGFGGGKTHALMTLWHLAENIGDASLGTELLPAAGRPKRVRVVAIDASRAGVPQFGRRDGVEIHSLWGDVFYKLAKKDGLKILGRADNPDASPSDSQLEQAFPDGPVLFLLDELVIYMAKLSEQGQGNFLGFLNMLVRAVSKRPQTALVITDPAAQVSYAAQAAQLQRQLEASKKLNDILNRSLSDSDPIGNEGARVIARRLFEKVDLASAERTSSIYHELYKRVAKDHPTLLPQKAATPDYARKIVDWYPFHPRLIETAEGRLDELKDFQRSRGVLRLFARILRDVWESKNSIDLITAGDIDWSSPRIVGDLISRLGRDKLHAAISSDVLGHAAELDGDKRGIHCRAAAALMYESIPLTPSSGLDLDDLTLAILRPEEAGTEPAEAMERLAGSCWHTYSLPGGKGYQFRVEPNVIKQIEERLQKIDPEDARQQVFAEVQGYYQGAVFKLAAWPERPRQVTDSAELQLVLCEDRKTAEAVCKNADESPEGGGMPRSFRNAIVAVAPTGSVLEQAVSRARRLLAAKEIVREAGSGDQGKLVKEQIHKVMPELEKQFRLQAARAFDQVVMAGGTIGAIDEKFKFSDEEILRKPQGQTSLRRFLEEKQLIYGATDALDIDRFVKDILPGAVPVAGSPDVFTGKAIHERFLGAPKLRLIPDALVVQNTLRKAVETGRVVVHLEDGTAFDDKGCVRGPKGDRRRTNGETLARLPLTDATQVTAMGSASAKEWLKEDEAKKKGVKGVEEQQPPPPPPESDNAADTWPEIVRMATLMPLVELRLSATSPTDAQTMTGLIQPLGADGIRLFVNVGGTIKDGGKVNFMMDGVKPAHPLKPLATAQAISNGLAPGGVYSAGLILTFDGGRTGLSDTLSAIADTCPEGIRPIASFARETSRRPRR